MSNAAAHPEPERLAALAGDDADARADSALLEHVAACMDCDRQVREMTTLRSALAALPDLAPSRTFQLVPPVPAQAPSGWRVAFRRAFAPVAVAGLALVLVGGVGVTGALGPADAQRLFVLPFQQAAGPEPAGPAITDDDGNEAAGGEDTDGGQRPTTASPPPPESGGAGALGPSPRPSQLLGEEAPAEEPGSPRGEGLEAESPVTSGWLALLALGVGLLAVAVALRTLAPKRAAPH